MSVIEQIKALGLKVGDTIEGTQSGRITGSTEAWRTTTRLTLIWQGSEVAVWRETTNSWRMPAGEWTPPRENASWSLDCRDWRIIDRAQESQKDKIYAERMVQKRSAYGHNKDHIKMDICRYIAEELMPKITIKEEEDRDLMIYRASGYWIDEGGA